MPTTCSLPMIADFLLSGDGSAAAWSTIPWHDLARVEGSDSYRTRCKQARSATGLYLLVDCQDERLDCTHREDGADLFTEDVVEWFLQPDPSIPVYVEYEISPLGRHLVLIVINNGTAFHGWTGWKVDGKRAIRRAVSTRGGPCEPGAQVSGWSVEAFLPWTLFQGFANVPPQREWRGNVYRIDQSKGRCSKWALAPETGGGFHRMDGFATLRFS